ncbi:M20/M25/M40 family metallo-hydrolase [Rhizobium sp. NFR12]|uniref:M20/M25/M40 family metallo-hydrolase n=1 Tax=Rhizobium sp. NFR12 TaxID=1566261 RepID=UPI0008A79AF9|nr:M20/M25/M40 family metallo-hydrolase [Rhizobium sp. NFR12]SEH26128.1 Acetylornithine deacetylase/Succinyl-diaminopimelate desuccinylase [Rhizobium sp. NFR12]
MTNHITRKVLDHAGFKSALTHIDAGYDRFVDELITLTEIPAPPFREERKAAAYLEMMQEAGLEEAARDEIGNVCGLIRGTGNDGYLVVAAHLDTVFPEGTDVTVRREGTKLFAPGVGDDTRGLAANLTLMRAIKQSGIRPKKTILLVGDVGEEGKGDLRGIRHLFTEGQYRDRIDGFISVDGPETARIVNQAVGSYRYRVTFNGPGGHSYGAFGTVNPAYAMAEVLTGLSELHLPTEPKTTATPSVFGGGTSINATPETVWFELDLRSVSQTELDRIDGEFHALLEKAVAAENARADISTGKVTVEAMRIGHRPAGAVADNAPIITSSLDAIKAFGFEPRLTASSTDANIPISLGVPAVCIGSGSGVGGRAHSLEEWIDVDREPQLRSLHALLAVILSITDLED